MDLQLLQIVMDSRWLLIAALASLVNSGAKAQSCPVRYGRLADPSQCDAYTECRDGQPIPQLCPDGLLFDEASLGYPCKYPQEVDCQGRTATQPPQPTADCPHQFGYYKLGDEAHCGQFMNCANGVGHIFDCPEGLAFNEDALRCDWPDQVPSCNAEAYLGFSCPDPLNTAYGADGYLFFRSPNDCSKYFLCIKGRPRLLSCSKGEAFNEFINSCDAAENVTGCAIGPHIREATDSFDIPRPRALF